METKSFVAVATKLPGSKRQLFAFPMIGKEVFEIAGISRIERTEKGAIEGFQRPEVKKHIREIADYIRNADAMIPNAVVLAFRKRAVKFEPLGGKKAAANGEHGILTVQVYSDEEEKAGWVVDGQQRSYALAQVDDDKFPIMVCAFIEDSEEVLMQQFVNVNSTRALPRQLVNELLPHLEAVPERLRGRKVGAMIAEKLAFDEDSPLNGVVKSETVKDGVIQINSLIQAIEQLLRDPTCYVGSKIDAINMVGTFEEVVETYKAYWAGVKSVFKDAWGLKPKDSRLMHGAGIWAMMHLSSQIIDDVGANGSTRAFANKLKLIAPYCHWTEDSGDWDDIDGFGRSQVWNGFQNTAQDKKLLTAHLSRRYRGERG